MRTRALEMTLLSLVALLMFGGAARAEDKPQAAPAAASASTKIPPFDKFHILIERNIFDASRKPWVGASGAADASAPPSQTWRLMGTWLEDDRAVALFEGMPAATHATIERGAEVAGGYHVQEIRPNGVLLNNDKGTSELRVGAGLAKSESGDWSVVDSVAPSPEPPAAPPQPAAAPTPVPAKTEQNPPPNGTPPAGPVKRLLKQIRKGLGS